MGKPAQAQPVLRCPPGGDGGGCPPLVDATVWVQSDDSEVRRREAGRVSTSEALKSGQDDWLRGETPFIADQRPSERAAFIVAATPDIPHDPETEIIVSDRCI
jgi:hypothetical protein